MKTSSENGAPERKISRPTAWAYFTGNLAFPGAGSLSAGRWSGFPQLLLALVGTALTMYFGIRFVSWYVENFDRLQGDSDDPIATLAEMWLALRWAALGIGLFVFSWLWSLATSFHIFRSNRTPPVLPPSAPPRIE